MWSGGRFWPLGRAVVDEAGLRDRLARARGSAGRPGGDEGHEAAAGPAVPAAVLVGLVPREGGPAILLTQRTAHLRDHAGQISLPGGRIEQGEAPVEAALREAEEEIGLPPDRVGLLGELPPYRHRHGLLHPPGRRLGRPAGAVPARPFEVAELFEVPLSFVLDPANHRRDSYERNGKTRQFYVLPYEGRYIWGATAGILVGLSRILRD